MKLLVNKLNRNCTAIFCYVLVIEQARVSSVRSYLFYLLNRLFSEGMKPLISCPYLSHLDQGVLLDKKLSYYLLDLRFVAVIFS